MKPQQSSFAFDVPNEHHELIHNNQVGTVNVWLNKKTWLKIEPGDAAVEVRSFLESLTEAHDTYLSVNEFYGWRRTDLLKSLRACYVDLDLNRLTTQSDLDEALDVLYTKKMPSPSLVVFTGRGLHLYWLLKPTPASALPVWQIVENALVDSLKDFYADTRARDCARVLRLVGTVNSKNAQPVRGQVLDGQPWALHQLADEVLGERQPKAKVKSFEKAQVLKGIHPKATTHRRWHLVLQDLYVIARHYGTIPEGHRNNWLFIASVALSWFASPDSIEDEIIDLMKQYCPDLSDSDAIQASKSSVKRAQMSKEGKTMVWNNQAVDARYRYKRQTLYSLLEPLAKPIVSQLKAIIPNELAIERKKQNDSKRWSDKKTNQGYMLANADKVAQARSMKVSGMKQSDIAKALGVGQSTVSKWLK